MNRPQLAWNPADDDAFVFCEAADGSVPIGYVFCPIARKSG